MVECVEVNLKGIARSIDSSADMSFAFSAVQQPRCKETTTTKRRVLQKSVCNTDTLPLVSVPLLLRTFPLTGGSVAKSSLKRDLLHPISKKA